MYRNPVIRGFHPDPSICRVGDDFYLVTSSFEYFPGLPVFHSTDLVNWARIGHCLTRPDQVDLSHVPTSGGIWAPTIRHRDGVFHVVTTVMDESWFANELDADGRVPDPGMRGRHFLVTATDPAGPWSDPVWIDGPGLDPSLLFDDGRVLLTYADAGVVLQCELDPSTGQHLSPTRAIWTGTNEVTSEGPHLYRVGDTYYLLVAEGGTSYGHSIAIARSSSPWGPWEDHPSNPMLSHRTAAGHPLQATGHGDLVEDADGQWWLVFLAIRSQGWPAFHVLGRETCLAPVRWQDGWPFVDGPVDLEVDHARPEQLRPPPLWRDTFTSPQLDGRWNTVRGPDPGVAVTHGRLTLRPPCAGRSFVGTRQLEVDCTARVQLLPLPEADDDECGLTVRMNDRHHYDLGVVRVDGAPAVRLRRRIGSLVHDGPAFPVTQGPVTLEVTSTAWTYSFRFVGAGGGPDVLVGRAEAFYLSTEVAGGFTGVYIGPYAAGTGGADVDWFELRETSGGSEPGTSPPGGHEWTAAPALPP